MIGWFIFGGIVLFIVVLLTFSVNLNFNYDNKVDFKIKYIAFTLFPLKKKKNKVKKEKKVNKTKAKVDMNSKSENSNQEKRIIKKVVSGISDNNKKYNDKNNDKTDSDDLINKASEKIDIKLIRLIIESFAHPFGRLFKKIRFNDVYIKSVIKGDDAAVIALNYGLQSIVINSFTAYLKSLASVNVKEIRIIPDFNSCNNYDDKSGDLYIRCKIKIRLAVLVFFAIVSFYRFLIGSLKQKSEEASTKTKPTRGKSIKAVKNEHN